MSDDETSKVNTDWILAIADAFGMGSGLNCPVIPGAFKECLEAYVQKQADALTKQLAAVTRERDELRAVVEAGLYLAEPVPTPDMKRLAGWAIRARAVLKCQAAIEGDNLRARVLSSPLPTPVADAAMGVVEVAGRHSAEECSEDWRADLLEALMRLSAAEVAARGRG